MKFYQEFLYYFCKIQYKKKMDKEEFLKSKLKKIAYNHGINIESSVVFKEIMAELLDIYMTGFDEGYNRDWY